MPPVQHAKVVTQVVLSDDESDNTAVASFGLDKRGDHAVDGAEDLVRTKCATCDERLCDIANEWFKVTGSYYLETHPGKYGRGMSVMSTGGAKPGGKGSRLEGCALQPFICEFCSEIIGFKCLSTPPGKEVFKDRDFFKLSRMVLVSPEDGSVVEPIEVPRPSTFIVPELPKEDTPNEIQHINSEPSKLIANKETQKTSKTQQIPTIPMPPTPSEADMEAIEALKVREEPWRDVHEVWERATKRGLSPAAFGRHLMTFPQFDMVKRPVGSAKPNSKRAPRVAVQNSRVQHPVVNYHPNQPGNWTQQQQQQQQLPSQPPLAHSQTTGPMPADNLAMQRQDINRIDQAVNGMAQEMASLRAAFEELGREVRSRTAQPRPAAKPLNSDDADALELLSDTVSGMTSKIGEIDGLKMQIELLKRRIKKVESADAPVPSGAEYLDTQPSPQVVPASQNSNPHWAATHPLKRKATLDLPGAIANAKRQTLSSNPQSLTRNIASPSPVAPAPDFAIPHGNNQAKFLVSTPADQPLKKRGPGRPRKSDNFFDKIKFLTDEEILRLPSMEPGSSSTHSAADDFISAFFIPKKDKNRRGTRTKPIRNAEGVLIRKDGKPDQRSISSPQNLKRVHEMQRTASVVAMSSEKPSPSASGEGAAPKKGQSPLSLGNGIGEGVPKNVDEDDSLTSLSTPDVEMNSANNGDNNVDGENEEEQQQNDDAEAGDNVDGHVAEPDKHTGIMRAMFPHGVFSDAERMSPGTRILQPESKQPHLQDRADAQNDGVRATMRNSDVAAAIQQQLEEEMEG